MHPSIRLLLPLCVAGLTSACVTFQTPPSVSASANASSAYLFRGVPQVDALVLQADLDASITDTTGGTYRLSTWVNVDGSNNTGDAVFPRNNGGEVTEIDFVQEYSREFDGWSGAVGLTSYHYPDGVGPSTNELYVAATLDGPLSPTLVANYDFDVVDGLYVQAGLSQEWELSEDLVLDAGVSLGFADSDQGRFYWGDHSSGLSHIEGVIGVSQAYSEHVTLFVRGHGASILSNDYEDALDMAHIDTDNLWVTVGATLGF